MIDIENTPEYYAGFSAADGSLNITKAFPNKNIFPHVLSSNDPK